MNGIYHAHGFKHKIHSANPLSSQIVVDLRSRHLAYWRQLSASSAQDLNSTKFTFHHWCAPPTKNAQVSYFPCVLPKYLYLDLHKHIARNVAHFAFASTHSKLSKLHGMTAFLLPVAFGKERVTQLYLPTRAA
eukprot:1148703-Pelagomonas_calceolata.AAC.1